MATVTEGVPGERSTRILDLIQQLQTRPNADWRAAGKAYDESKRAEVQKTIDELERQLRDACQPKPLRLAIRKAEEASQRKDRSDSRR